jgi:hypothetical protein
MRLHCGNCICKIILWHIILIIILIIYIFFAKFQRLAAAESGCSMESLPPGKIFGMCVTDPTSTPIQMSQSETGVTTKTTSTTGTTVETNSDSCKAGEFVDLMVPFNCNKFKYQDHFATNNLIEQIFNRKKLEQRKFCRKQISSKVFSRK